MEKVLALVFISVLALVVGGAFWMFAWNNLMPHIFGLPHISLGQGMLLMFITGALKTTVRYNKD